MDTGRRTYDILGKWGERKNGGQELVDVKTNARVSLLSGDCPFFE